MTAKENILNKLRHHLQGTTPITDKFDEDIVTKPWHYNSTAEKINQLRNTMEAVRTEIHLTQEKQWVHLFAELLQKKQIKNCIYSPDNSWGKTIEQHWQGTPNLPELKLYNTPIEQCKQELFYHIDASITSTRGAIAATGSLIVWPTPAEPRLMSLLPPTHFAILEASKIHNNFYEAQQALDWKNNVPTNALLISGPSKTADIEQVMAYGAHGPKDLVVLIIEDL